MADKYMQVTASNGQKAIIRLDTITKVIDTTSWRTLYQGGDNYQVTNTMAAILAALEAAAS